MARCQQNGAQNVPVARERRLTLYREPVTATRDAKSDLDPIEDGPGWGERSAFGTRRGFPWWGAVLTAIVLAAVGVFIDIERAKQLGMIFQACYFFGCVIAVCGVQRRSIFGPMVQPPLILALTVPTVILLTAAPTNGGLASKALAVGTPLINGFPVMAVTTGSTLLIGVIRLFTQRKPRQAEPPRRRPASARSADRADARQAGARQSGARRPAAGAGRQGSAQPGRPQPKQAGREPARQQPSRQSGAPSSAAQPARRPGRPAQPPRKQDPPRRSRGFED